MRLLPAIIFICWSTLITGNDHRFRHLKSKPFDEMEIEHNSRSMLENSSVDHLLKDLIFNRPIDNMDNWKPLANTYSRFPEFYMDKLITSQCQEIVFINARLSDINQDFIISSVITCLNITNNNIERIAKNAFRKLPNLTYLDLSHNNLNNPTELFSFGSHKNLKGLFLDNAIRKFEFRDKIEISEENYPNLEILSLRNNIFTDIWTSRMKFLIENSNIFQFPNYLHTENDLSFSNHYIDDDIIQKAPFPKLKYLDLSGNNMISTDFVKLLPSTLRCLDLHNNLLTTLTLSDKGKNLLTLNLNNNNFYSVRKQSFVPFNLNERYNQHTYNEYNSHDLIYQYNSALNLSGLENLVYLSISNNKINFIESTAFQDINKLVYLNLSANEINNLDKNTFASLQSLSTLDLSFNNLQSVPLFSRETNISVLFLNCNKIQKIISHSFIQTSRLTKLFLEENQIFEIDIKAFDYLYNLEELNLSKNLLHFLPEGWTNHLLSLKYLNLSNNTFTSLESLPLINAVSLIEIHLIMNPLKHLNVNYFESLPQNLTINLM
ncbi:protein artichoke-like [Pogonomyrmex barbatus]|uniref:Protein artichoke-like n=1 Tax=Pogonomyrmex barbatus TaxID=144034 RepID=A0A6I9VZP2_9HYME|nr:protein artichoke-like [Pogonomyrmex barbatus]